VFRGDGEERSARRRDAAANEPEYRNFDKNAKQNELLGAIGGVFCL
jgi:hypothetical protein